MDSEMQIILKKLGYGLDICASFEREKITPDIVCNLSMLDMRSLGISNCSDMMKLRVECLAYGHDGGTSSYTSNGEPKYSISKETLENLIEAGFKIHEISKLLSLSERTIYRRMVEFNLAVHKFTDIDGHRLQEEVQRIIGEFPRIGETMIRHVLQQRGIKVRRSLLREILHDIDSVGIRQRMHRRLHRRVYHVKAPNHLWHLDTNHKLIRWHFVICGGVDGFSRFIVYLKCENNNKADTLLKCFLDASERHGTPLRIRTDQGMENFKIAEYMIRTRGANRKSVIAGKSTHNQRIERLWRDVYEGVLCLYYDLFHFMEDNGILDPLNENHIYALHYVFCDKINEKLEIWKMAWARHRLRTARSSPRSPIASL